METSDLSDRQIECGVTGFSSEVAMENGRGLRVTRGTALALGVLRGLGLTYFLGLFGMWFGASAAAYDWPGEAAAAQAVLLAALVCLIAVIFDLTGAVVAWRRNEQRAARLYRFAGGGFAVVAALSFWAAVTATDGDLYGRLGIAGVVLALVTPWWSRWLPQ
jgi:hypothetical protein